MKTTYTVRSTTDARRKIHSHIARTKIQLQLSCMEVLYSQEKLQTHSLNSNIVGTTEGRMKTSQETKQMVDATMQQLNLTFQSTFKLRAYPEHLFRVSEIQSYVNDNDVVMLYTQVKTKTGWVDFCKGTALELIKEIR